MFVRYVSLCSACILRATDELRNVQANLNNCKVEEKGAAGKPKVKILLYKRGGNMVNVLNIYRTNII